VKADRAAPGLGRAVRLVLPREHGSWSLALEPLVLGLVAAPSAAGAALAVAVLAGFFLRRPLQALGGAPAGERPPLTLLVTGGLAAVAAAAVGLAVAVAGPARLWPLLPAGLAGAVFVGFDTRHAGREQAAELAGAAAFAWIPAAFASAAGWSPAAALALALAMAGRSMPTVLTVRTYLRGHRGQAVSRRPALAASGAALVVAVLLARAGLAPWFGVAVSALLAIRAVILLAPTVPRLRATTVGVAEAVIGGILVLLLGLSWIP
jgi:YwiC-like protein